MSPVAHEARRLLRVAAVGVILAGRVIRYIEWRSRG